MNYLLKFILLIFTISILPNAFTQVSTNPLQSFNNSTLKFLENTPLPDDENLPDININLRTLDTITGESGFNSINNTLAIYDCYKTPKTKKGSMKSKGTFSSSMSRSELFTELGLGINATIGVKDVNVGAYFKFSNIFEENSSSSSFYYYVKFTRSRFFSYEPLADLALTESGLKLLEKSKKDKNNKIFYFKCGDMLVKNVEEGALVIVQVNVQFKSVYEKQKFDFGVNVKFMDIVDVGANLSKSMDQLKLNGKTVFRAKQFGGDSQRFNMMFPDNISEKCSAAVNPQKRRSSPNANSECTEFLNTISNYFKTDFPNQFNDELERYFVFNFEKFYYEDLELR